MKSHAETRTISPTHARRYKWAVAILACTLFAAICVGHVTSAAAAGQTIMFVAAHPDDDLIAASGVIASAHAAGDTVIVAYMTNGDAYIASGDTTHTQTGLRREAEAVAGETVLGTPETDLIFLGYPDGSLDQLYFDYPLSSQVFTGAASGVSQTYGARGLKSEDYHFGKFLSHANYNGANVIQDLTSILDTYKPVAIYTTSEFDQHPDHACTYYFVAAALQAETAADSSYKPTLHKTIIWANSLISPTWPTPQQPGGDPTENFTEPPGLPAITSPEHVPSGLAWTPDSSGDTGNLEQLEVPVAMQSPGSSNPKYQAINQEDSQGGPFDFLGWFIHKDEIFWQEPAGTFTINNGAAYTGSRTVTLNSTVSDALSLQMGFSDDATPLSWQSYNTSKSWTLSSGDGPKIVHGQYQDASGYSLTWAETITLDTTAPISSATNLQATNNSGWVNANQSVTLTANDGGGAGGGSISYKVNNGGTQSYSAPIPVTSAGSTKIEYWASDSLGNTESSHHVGYVNIDKIAPTVTSSADADTAWHRSDVTVTLSPLDQGGSGVAKTQYKLHGTSTWLDAAGNQFTVAGPADGSNNGAHVYDYQALDNAGNVSVTGTCTVRIATAPNTSVASPLAGSANTGWITHAQTITLTASGGYGSVTTYYTVDGVQHTYAGPFDVSGEGSHLVTYWSQDSVGYVEAHHTGYVNIDATAPTTSAVASPAGWTKGRVTVTLSAADGSGSGVATTYYKVGAGGQTTTYAGPVAFTSQGVATVYFWSVDAVGNVGQAQTVQVMIDKTRPNTWARADVAVKRGKVATFSYRMTDNLSPDSQVTIKIFTGHKVVKSIAVGWKAKGNGIFKWKCKLAKRTYTWKVYATDRAGNTQLIKSSKSLWVK